MAPITASQFGTNKLMQTAVLGGSHRSADELTTFQRIGCAATAGAASAFIASPSELIIIQQQKSGRSLMAEISSVVSQHGVSVMARGITPAIGRETLYAMGYLGLFPVLEGVLDERLKGKGLPESTSMIAAGLTGGVFAAMASHPFDTCKTRMQAFMYSKPEYRTFSSTAATIYKEGGVFSFWKGITPRMSRIVAATFILNATRNKAVAWIDGERLGPEL
ncbi:MAG: hypothetical protein WDW38_009872 [Sanguina aurantia]